MDPQTLGPYEIRSRLGRGGMGSVYEAIDRSTGATVALKTLTVPVADDAPIRQRFLAEIEVLKGLRHPGIVQMLAFGEQDGQPYFAMELVRGRSLEQLLRANRRFTPSETVALAREIARALKGAHDHGIIHRDLKPANLLLPDQPVDGVTVKLADFGIARLFGVQGATQHGSVVGTLEYMAPEQCTGGPIDQRADLYALGLVMFAMLTGHPPFRSRTHAELIERQRSEEPPALSRVTPGISRDLETLVARLLAKAPAARPASALGVVRLLEGLDLERPTTAPAIAVPAERAAGRTGTARPGRATAGPGLPTVQGDGLRARPVNPAPPDATTEHGGVAARPMARDATGELLGDTTELPPQAGPSRLAVVATGRVLTAASDAVTQAGAAAPHGHPATVPEDAPGDGARTRRDMHMTVEQLDRQRAAETARTARRRWWLRAVGTALSLVVLGGGGGLLLRTPSADDIYERILAVASAPEGDLRDVRPLIDTFLRRHASDPRATEIRGLGLRLRVDALDRRTRRRLAAGRTAPPIERDYRAAVARETESPTAAIAMLGAILEVHPDPADDDAETWRALVDRERTRLAPLAAQERAEDLARAAATLAEARDLGERAGREPDAAVRTSLLDRRRTLLTSLGEIYGKRPHAADLVAEANRLLTLPDPVSDVRP